MIPGGFSWFRLEAGANYTCGVTSAARTYCWGDVHYLGDGRTVQPTDIGVSTPVEVVGQSFFTLANYLAACGMSTSGAPYCWGANDTGQLGIGVADPQPSIYRTTPQKVKTTVLLP